MSHLLPDAINDAIHDAARQCYRRAEIMRSNEDPIDDSLDAFREDVEDGMRPAIVDLLLDAEQYRQAIVEALDLMDSGCTMLAEDRLRKALIESLP